MGRGKAKLVSFKMLYKSKKECKHSKYYFEKGQNFNVRYNILALTVSEQIFSSRGKAKLVSLKCYTSREKNANFLSLKVWEHDISFSHHSKGYGICGIDRPFLFLPVLPVLELVNNLWGLGTE